MRYGLNLLQNFTYFLANPVDGDQFEQVDRRTSTGGKVIHRRLREFLGRPMEWKAGTQFRHDDASVIGLYDTVQQRRTNTVREDALRQTSLGVFGEGVLDWTSFFRTSVGIPADIYRFAVDANNPLNSGAGVDSIVSPKTDGDPGTVAADRVLRQLGRGIPQQRRARCDDPGRPAHGRSRSRGSVRWSRREAARSACGR